MNFKQESVILVEIVILVQKQSLSRLFSMIFWDWLKSMHKNIKEFRWLYQKSFEDEEKKTLLCLETKALNIVSMQWYLYNFAIKVPCLVFFWNIFSQREESGNRIGKGRKYRIETNLRQRLWVALLLCYWEGVQPLMKRNNWDKR